MDRQEAFVLRNRATLEHVAALEKAFPEAALHRRALHNLGSDFSYASEQPDGVWHALVHFSPIIQGQFGLTRDVLAVYSPHADLQPRLFKALPLGLQSLPPDRGAEDHVFLVFTRDIQTMRKVDNWSAESAYVAIALPRAGASEDEGRVATTLMESFYGRLADRNLYDETLPVTGRDFFGRRQLLAQILDDLRQGNVCGIFGLRKTGKTSVIKELGQRLEQTQQSRVFVLRDLETLPSDPRQIATDLVQDLRVSLLEPLRANNVRTYELVQLNSRASVGEFRRALQPILTDAKRRDVQIIVGLDEVESLVGDAAALRQQKRPDVPEILGTLRSLVQENENFNVLFSGITSAIMECGELYGRENPLFSWAKPHYIPPMAEPDIRALTLDVGRRMAVNWSDDALKQVWKQSQGNVFLHRTLCAKAVANLPPDVGGRTVQGEGVLLALKPWRRDIVQRLEEMLVSTRRHYPLECELLDSFVQDPGGFGALEQAFPSEANRLLKLALLKEDSAGNLSPGGLTSRLIDLALL